MSSQIFHIDESNKFSLNKAHDSNRIYYSALKEWHTENAFRAFSIKYVVEGTIHYEVEDSLFNVDAGQFLLANQRDQVNAYFHSARPTRSFCIDINGNLIAEAATVMTAKSAFDFDNYLDRYYSSAVICKRSLPVSGGQVGQCLLRLSEFIQSNPDPDLLEEWFCGLAELIVLQEKGNYLALNGLKSVKFSTRAETLKRLHIARSYMDENFSQKPRVNEIARYSHLSEFHFSRSFRQAFGSSPYQYILMKRLEMAKELLRKNLPVATIAKECGFADVFSFSKSFRKAIGTGPAAYRRNL